MNPLLPYAGKVAALLRQRKEAIAVAESSAGGLISAALLAVPGASDYFVGGAVVYTRTARLALLGIGDGELAGIRPSTVEFALLLARAVRKRHATHWGIGETGAAGPTGNRYGNAPGHACLAVAGAAERTITLETGSGDRLANMYAFATAALKLAAESLASD